MQPDRLLAWISRAILLPPALIFCIISYRHLTDPAHAIAGASLTSPQAFTDTRVLGAWMLALVFLLVVTATNRSLLWLAHAVLVVFMGLTLVVRLYGFAHDGTTLETGNQGMIVLVEVVFFTLNTLALTIYMRGIATPAKRRVEHQA